MANSRRAIIAGNWKMYKSTAEAEAFVASLWERLNSQVNSTLPEVVLCPPFTALQTTQQAASKLKAPFTVAAQTMESREQGAFTGEVSPLMLLDIGIRWAVIGHSERRQYFNETDETVAQKTQAAFKHGMTPIVCVGENLEEREAGNTDRVIERQMAPILALLSSVEMASSNAELVLAYEPVWAIGTGRVCEADEAGRVCKLIRDLLRSKLGNSAWADRTRILYGGSVKPDNVKSLMAQPDIDGALVGGASLDVDSFYALIDNTCLVNA